MPDRREKNLHHLVTIISLIFGLALLWLLVFLEMMPLWGIYSSAIGWAILMGARTIIVELGIRRRSSRRT